MHLPHNVQLTCYLRVQHSLVLAYTGDLAAALVLFVVSQRVWD